MNIILKLLCEYPEGLSVYDRDNIHIEIQNPSIDNFNKEFVLSKILEAQHNGTFDRKWILCDCLNDNLYDITFNIDKLCIDNAYLISDTSIDPTHILSIEVTPESTSEIDIYMRTIIKKQFNSTDVTNSILELPCHIANTIDIWDPVSFGNYLIMHSIDYNKSSDYLNRDIHSYWYCIHSKELVKTNIDIYAHEWLVPHVIGKGGKKIKEALNNVKIYGSKNVERLSIKYL